MDTIRVLIIEDSAFMRKMITEILESDDRIRVIGTAKNGQEGLEKVKALSPDVVTLDIIMPYMDGMTTLEKIMEETPVPVVMLASSPKESNDLMQAISKGAVDFITKPSGPISLDIEHIKEEIIQKVITASTAKVTTPQARSDASMAWYEYHPRHRDTLLVIGSSTGGPRALQAILSELPADFPAPILIAQHMPAGFTKSLASRLNSLSAITVKEAEDGEQIQNGVAYVAPGNLHMTVQQQNSSLTLKISKQPEDSLYRPSIDVLLASIADVQQVNKMAIILTGMGRDGAKGIQQIKKKDSQAFVIAEAEESSVIYGMPKAAIQTGCVDQVLHLHNIARMMEQMVINKGRD